MRDSCSRMRRTSVPAGTDIRRMREQLSRVERRLDQLSYDVADLDEDGRPRTRVK